MPKPGKISSNKVVYQQRARHQDQAHRQGQLGRHRVRPILNDRDCAHITCSILTHVVCISIAMVGLYRQVVFGEPGWWSAPFLGVSLVFNWVDNRRIRQYEERMGIAPQPW